jgi:hypothetical protein
MRGVTEWVEGMVRHVRGWLAIVCCIGTAVTGSAIVSCSATGQEVTNIPTCGTYRIASPTVVAFFNYASVQPNDPNLPDVIEDFRLTVQRLRERLDDSVIAVHECYQSWFEVNVPGKALQHFTVGPEGAGYYLVSPAVPAKVEYGVMTDEDVINLMRQHFGTGTVTKALRTTR